jgi:hypothetical protein
MEVIGLSQEAQEQFVAMLLNPAFALRSSAARLNFHDNRMEYAREGHRSGGRVAIHPAASHTARLSRRRCSILAVRSDAIHNSPKMPRPKLEIAPLSLGSTDSIIQKFVHFNTLPL